jgi:hypothetical protein
MIVHFDGYETGSSLLSNTTIPGTSAVSTTGRDGVGVAVRGNGAGSILKTFTSGSDTIFWHQGTRVTDGYFGSTSISGILFNVRTDSGASIHLSANIDATGHITLRRGNSAGTVIQTSTLTFPTGFGWHSIEGKATVHDTTGECIIKVDGVEWINFTGDTRNAGTSTRPDAMSFGVDSGLGPFQDDFLIVDTTGASNNSWTGEISIVGIRPSGNGANSGLTGSDGNSTDNYLLVDEVALNTSDYVGSATTGALDTYDMTAVGKTGTVVAVQNLAYAAKSDAGTKSFKHVTRSSGGTLLKSSDVALSTTYLVYSGPIWLQDADSLDWTVSRVNSAEFGFEVV